MGCLIQLTFTNHREHRWRARFSGYRGEGSSRKFPLLVPSLSRFRLNHSKNEAETIDFEFIVLAFRGRRPPEKITGQLPVSIK